MLIERGRFKLLLYTRPHHQDCNMATTVGSISAGAFVKYHDQDTVFLELGVAQQRPNIRFQPVICLRQGAIMCIVIQIGNDKREIRQLVVAEVRCELGERD
ncbi:MAG TPA: hypothetical protein VLN58_00945, partial [Verrucomicrobiae bacterium]|nr:hypothetical protein [Verrucomicrobiae bacterium]